MGILINYTERETGLEINNAYVNLTNIIINKNNINGYYAIYSNYENVNKGALRIERFQFEYKGILEKEKIDIYDVVYNFLKNNIFKDNFVSDK